MRNIELFKAFTTQKEILLTKSYFEDSIKEHVFSLWHAETNKFIQSTDSEKIKEMNRGYIWLKETKIEALKKILNMLNERGLEAFVIKGIAFSHIIYNDFYIREDNDVDLLIDKQDFSEVNKVLLKNGFTSNFMNDYDQVHLLDAYEVKYNNKEGAVIEVKLATSSIKDMDVLNKLKKDFILVQNEELTFKTFNVFSSYLLLCTSVFSNIEGEFAKFKIRDLIDLYHFSMNEEISLKWIQFIGFADNLNLLNQVKASLTVLNKLSAGTFNQLLNLLELHYDQKKYSFAYVNGFIHDWNNIDELVSLTHNRKMHLEKLYQLDSKRAYSNKNLQFNKKIVDKNNKKIEKFYSIKNENIVEEINVEQEENDVVFKIQMMPSSRQVNRFLMIYDLSKSYPRTIIEIKKSKDNTYIPQVVLGNLSLKYSFENDNNNFSLKINLLQQESYLKYKMLSFKNFYTTSLGGIDYALKSEDDEFALLNPNIVTLI